MDERIPRNSRAGRLLHLGHVSLTLWLILTELQFYFPALPIDRWSEWLLLGHRFFGLAWGGLPVLAVALRFRGTVHFLSEYTRWSLNDLVWLIKFLPSLIRPDRVRLPVIKTKINPGERLVGQTMLAICSVLFLSGLVRMIGEQVPRGVVNRAEVVHQAAALLLYFVGAMHMTVGSGILPAYRGVWRAMFGDGSIEISLGRRHWPFWTSQNLLGLWPPPVTAGHLLRAAAVIGGLLALAGAVLFYSPGRSP